MSGLWKIQATVLAMSKTTMDVIGHIKGLHLMKG